MTFAQIKSGNDLGSVVDEGRLNRMSTKDYHALNKSRGIALDGEDWCDVRLIIIPDGTAKEEEYDAAKLWSGKQKIGH